MCYYLKSFNIPHVINHTVENTVIGFVLTCLKFDFYKRWRTVLEMIEKKKKEFENVHYVFSRKESDFSTLILAHFYSVGQK